LIHLGQAPAHPPAAETARNEAGAAVAPGVDFHLPDEILAMIPTDPYEELDVARKITSMAIASRVSRLEDDAARLRRDLADRDRAEANLRACLDDSDARLAAALDENVSTPPEPSFAKIVPVELWYVIGLFASHPLACRRSWRRKGTRSRRRSKS
jgi:hypothetical protein